MAFNNNYGHYAEKRAIVNPRCLRFTQPNIKSTFTDPEHPSVEETVSLLRRGRLNPRVLGPLHVSTDENGRMWCDNNRRLFALRKAGVQTVSVVFDGVRCPKKSLKSMLSDPDFMPRIRGEASRVQNPPRSTFQRHKLPYDDDGKEAHYCLTRFRI